MSAPTDIFTAELQPAIASLRPRAMRWLRDPNDVDDVMQATFVRAWKSADRFDPELGCARAWCFTILRNEASRFIASRSRLASRITSVDPAIIDGVSLTSSTPSVEDEFAETQAAELRRAKLRSSLRSLPHQFRQALEDELDGLDCKTAAALRHVSGGTIHSRRYRARGRIRAAAVA